MSAKRVYVEKRREFATEAESLRRELNGNLGLKIKELRLISVYDLTGFSDRLLEESAWRVFAEPATDTFSEEFLPDGRPYLATEYLPGQFDQRASSAEDCVRLIEPDADITIRSGKIMVFDPDTTPEEIEKIAAYCINPVDSRRKDLSRIAAPAEAQTEEHPDLKEQKADCADFREGMAMSPEDMKVVEKYFRSEGREPNLTELKIIDTYWSDHCRHTTFNTELTRIEVEPSEYSEEIEKTLADWKRIRKELGREEKTLCLMDLATIGARYLKHTGVLDNLEESEENNACSIFVDVDIEPSDVEAPTKERWLLQFKNETHNHPTEIEPYGGASTCIGGAVRDPLSGRAYVYQAMRVTGAGDIYQPIEKTLPGKLPQRVISLRAAAGYSSYGNQLGLATTHVREIYHPGYVAKRLEVGAVVGAVKASEVRRERPVAGDVILMIGGRTGRDGIGGATGSSKQHTVASLEECGSEVQKGNPPEERKIQRLFRRPEVVRLIKKSNDFGAGGISVAIGELADGLDIYLDRIKTKYSGLTPADLAISESQERMAVVVDPADAEKFKEYCREENIEVTHVADVTDSGRMRMMYHGETVADLSREFIDSAGAPHYAEALITAPGKRPRSLLDIKPEYRNGYLKDRLLKVLRDENVMTQKGLVEMFDSTIGASTVLMPYGGKTQRTETQVSVQTLPVGERSTRTASMMSFGFNPLLSEWSPYHGAQEAVKEAVAKIAAAGGDPEKMRFSYQEYFEKTASKESWGKPLAALLGALKMQIELGLPAIGGKDSMSGTFGELNVPPTLIAFGVTTADINNVISPEFKGAGHKLYLLPAFGPGAYRGEQPCILAAYALGMGGVAEAVAKMSFGNNVGARIEIDEEKLFEWNYGAMIAEVEGELPEGEYIEIGETIAEPAVIINGELFPIETLYYHNSRKFADVYPDRTPAANPLTPQTVKTGAQQKEPQRKNADFPKKENPLVYLPVFPGTNCDYDMADAFRREGARIEFGVFRNLTGEEIKASIKEMSEAIDRCDILALSGGFSAGDEPDGSGKFIANVLMNKDVAAAIERLLARGGLILGICNGFQALMKCGLLPFGKIGEVTPDSPTLTRNDINRHISQIVTTRLETTASPWLAGFEEGELFSVAASHGEGKFMASEEMLKRLEENGQIAFRYADPETGEPTMESPANPNGSVMAIEGIISPGGQILGKMAHSERYRPGLMKNIYGNLQQNIFKAKGK